MNIDLKSVMEENLISVWSERDPLVRLKSIKSLYAVDSSLYHVGHQVKGCEAINEHVSNILANMPAEFSFFKQKPVVINNNLGRLIWGMGSDPNSIVMTGMDIVVFEDEKIKSLYVFLDK